MTSDQWESSLHYLFCRSPHYLLDCTKIKGLYYQIWDHGDTVGFEWIGDYPTGDSCFVDQIFRVVIEYKKATREIRSFSVKRERLTEGSHYGSGYSERAVTSENKAEFYSIFKPYITKIKPVSVS